MNIERKELLYFMSTLQKGYAELFTRNPELFIEICGSIFTKRHDSRVIVEAYLQENNKNKSHTLVGYKKALDYYKSLYESEFGLSVSLFFAYIYEILKPELKKNKTINYVNLPSNLKYRALNDAWFSQITGFIDVILRNGWAGHENWELLDNGNIEITDINPYTGDTYDKYLYSNETIQDNITKLDKLWMYLDLSINIFLANNPLIKKRLWKFPWFNQKLKVAEIERRVRMLCSSYQLILKEFDFSNRTALKIVIKNADGPMGEPREMMTEHFVCDLVQQRISVRYIDQILSILIDILHSNEDIYFDSNIKILNKEDADILGFEWSSENFKKWHSCIDLNTKEKIYPTDFPEDIIKKSYPLIMEHKIKYWKWDYVRGIIKNPLFTLEYIDFTIAYFSID